MNERDDDNDGQIIFGDLGGLKFPDICLTGEEKPRKTSPRKPVPTGDRTRGPLRDRRACTTVPQRWTIIIIIIIIIIVIIIINSIIINHQCSDQGQILHCKRRNQGCSFTRDE